MVLHLANIKNTNTIACAYLSTSNALCLCKEPDPFKFCSICIEKAPKWCAQSNEPASTETTRRQDKAKKKNEGHTDAFIAKKRKDVGEKAAEMVKT